jgi:predicted secreted protein
MLLALGVFAMAATAACGAAPLPASGTTVVLHETDAGKTFNLHGGDTVRIVLDDAYPVPGSSLVWTVAGSPASVLQAGAATRSPQVRNGPGRTDKYTAEFRAVAAGQGLLDAQGTTSCEAMAKASCPDKHFTITVIVGR